MRIEPLTCHIGAELIGVSLADAARDEALFAEIKAACSSTACCSSRPGHHPRRARRLRAPVRRAGGPPGGRQRPGAPGPGAHLQDARHADRPLRERLAHRRHLARDAADGLRAALRRVPAGRRRHHVGQHGAGLREAARARQGADREPARAPQHRGQLRRGDADREAPCAARRSIPDAEHPVVRTHPETGEKVLFVNAFTTHFTNFHTGRERALRPGLRARAPASCCST